MSKKFATKFAALTISAFLAISGVIPALAAPDGQDTKSKSALSDNGQRAFADLGRCLQSQGKEKVLDVFYLIDESLSLQGTDSENKRAEILSSSLLQLASFRQDVTVNYSVAFFATEYEVWKSWTTLNRGGVVPEASRLAEEVRVRNEGRGTNWLIGINGAIEELNAQQERTNGCSTLIWLTDGGILLETAALTDDAVDQLCNNRFDVLRKNNVTVLGILLKNDEYLKSLEDEDETYNRERMAYMQPMVEGTGRLFNNSVKTCGTNPVPKNYRQGALFVAQDPKDLAFEFLKLPPQIEGCTESPSLRGKLTEFKIENGISGFQIVTKSPNWNLTDPTGKTVTANSKDISVFQTAGASQIKVGTSQSGAGKWKFAGDEDAVLYLCAGLDIVIDAGNNLIAGRPGSLSGKVILQRNGLPANLDVYASNHPITVQQIAGDGSSSAPVEAIQNAPSSFKLENFTPTAGQSELEIRVTLYLTTKDGFELAPISVAQKLEVRLPENYPSLKSNPIRLSTLKSSTEPATGTAEFSGPVGTNGKFCIQEDSAIKVIADTVDRSSGYKLKLSGLDASGCSPIRDGETNKVEFQISNSETADSDEVLLEIPITYYSDAEPDKKFTIGAKVAFKSEVPGDPLFWVILLTILGIGLPLGLIYLMSWLTTKIAFGRQVQRAAYPVMLTPSDRYTARDGGAIAIDGADFKIRPEQPDVRSFEDSVGTFRTKISKLVLAAPWFEVKASEGTRIITLVHAAPQLKRRFSTGKLAPIPGDMGKIWALQVSDADLLKFEKSTPIPGTLVVFKRNNLTNPNQFRDVFNGVTTKAGMWREVTRLADVVKNESAKPEKASKEKKGGKGGGSTPPTPPPPPSGPGRPGGGSPRPGSSGPTPVRPGSGSTSPVRPGSGSSAPSTPSAPAAPSTSSRPSGATTPSAPPPRPGSTQPPKRV